VAYQASWQRSWQQHSENSYSAWRNAVKRKQAAPIIKQRKWRQRKRRRKLNESRRNQRNRKPGGMKSNNGISA